jgi:ribonuclease G
MENEVLINVGAGETRLALVEGGRLKDLYIERRAVENQQRCGDTVVGNIMLGRVQRVLPGMQAAFVEVGLSRAGFLGAREARCLAELAGLEDGELPPISACVREGEKILVQVVKDPIADKGARLSANVTVAGRLLVYVPNQSGVALSRRIEDEDERDRLTQIVDGLIEGRCSAAGKAGGFIVRTAAIGMNTQALSDDAYRLFDQWDAIEKRTEGIDPPYTVYQDLDPVARAMRDFVNRETTNVLIDDVSGVAAAKSFREDFMPEFEPVIEKFDGPGGIFDLYDIQAEIDGMFEPRIELSSGAWITIESTEALTAIDVNSGSLTETTGLEETSVRTNVSAADEIGRQLRLRGVGGLIVIDFIHMDEPDNIAEVLSRLEAGLAGDRVPYQISTMSEFGLVEMTRKRVREPLSRQQTEDCRPCAGLGRLKTAATVANELLRSVEREARAAPGRRLKAVASPDVIRWIDARKTQIYDSLERRGAGLVTFEMKSPSPREKYEVFAEETVSG